MKTKRSFAIALSGVSCAMSIIALLGGLFSPLAKLAFYVIAAIFVALPLTKNMWAGAIASYAITAIIGFFAGNIRSFPFIFFFGIYAIVLWALDFRLYNAQKLPKVAKIVLIIIAKIAFFVASFFVCLALMKIVVGDINLFGWEWTLPTLLVVGFVAFSLYDALFRFVFATMQSMVNKYIKKK
ncbi:MAG: hypothetical protein RR416_03265 [Clostridia bacterium]